MQRIGSYVKAARPVDYKPYTTVQRGETGRVMQASEGHMIVKLDKYHAGLAGWDNTVLLEPTEAIAFKRTYRRDLAHGARMCAAAILAGVALTWTMLPGAGAGHASATRFERIVQEDGRWFVVKSKRDERDERDGLQGDPLPFILHVLSRREITPEQVTIEAARLAHGG